MGSQRMSRTRKSMGDIARAKTANRPGSPGFARDSHPFVDDGRRAYFTKQFKGAPPIETQNLIAFYQNVGPTLAKKVFRNLSTGNKRVMSKQITARKIPFLKLA
mmetsp:Transcript_20625/g.23857  ORF Transcript_20625/g.23857 Transcript_20625/m.23857 type:complete len:104 (-) Transcript_20625:654-965(-)